MYLVVDCETNGLPKDWRAPLVDLDNWPRAVQIAWSLYDQQHRQIQHVSRLIRPDGFRIPPEAVRVHGISRKRALRDGFPIRDVLSELRLAAQEARYFIAHNANFDGAVIAAEFLRQDWQPPFTPQRMICTMRSSVNYCRLPGGSRGYKWPKLEELYALLFGARLRGAHDAGVDVAACAACFFELEQQGAIYV